MLGWLRRLVSPPPPSRRELVELRSSVDALDARCEWIYQELKKLRGRVYSNEKHAAAGESSQDAPGATNDERAGAGAGRIPPALYTVPKRPLRRF